MTEEKRTSLLIVEDDLDIADMLNAYFRVQGYDVTAVNWGEDGIRACQADPPDLVILDIRLPDIDGFEVARRLRNNRRTQDIPIIFLTEKRDRMDRLKGLELRIEDYITKPFDIQELRLRVRNTLERSRRSTLTNPVTHIPEGSLVDEHLTTCLQKNNWAVLLVALRNLDQFRELYGFVASDDLLRAVGLMFKDVLTPNSDDFLGHMTQNDFVFVTSTANLPGLKGRLVGLEPSFDYFYSDQDRGKEGFASTRLSMRFHELLADAQIQDLPHLKARLDQMVRQGSH